MMTYNCGSGLCGEDMEYIGGGDWKCPCCGKIYAFGEPEDDGEDEGGEALSVWEAAEIYFSSGCDEDYMFGYTPEELTAAKEMT